MKNVTVLVRQLAIDAVTFAVAATLAVGGLWSLSSIGASMFTMVVFAVLMLPAFLSTAVYFGRDLKDATHTLIA